MSDIKIGIAGCGKQAPKHITGLRKIHGVSLVLADVKPDLAEVLAQQEGLEWVKTPDELFNDPDVRAIDICTPTPFHAPLIYQAIENSKDFFCEKPLCETYEQAAEIGALIDKHKRIGMVGYIYRFAPVFELAHEIFQDVEREKESSILGKVHTAVFRLGGRGGHHQWKHRKDQGGGAINEMLSHMLDLAIWFFGPPKDVSLLTCDIKRPERFIQGQLERVDAEDHVVAKIMMESGVEVLIHADLITPAFTQFLEVQGDNGTFMGSIQADAPTFVFLVNEAGGYKKGKTSFNFGPLNLFEAQMLEFVRSVRTRTKPQHRSVQDSATLSKTLENLRNGAICK